MGEATSGLEVGDSESNVVVVVVDSQYTVKETKYTTLKDLL